MKTVCLRANKALEWVCLHTHHVLNNITKCACNRLTDCGNTWYDTNESFRRKRSGYHRRQPHKKQCSSGRHGKCRYHKGWYRTFNIQSQKKLKIPRSKRKLDPRTQQKGVPMMDNCNTYNSHFWRFKSNIFRGNMVRSNHILQQCGKVKEENNILDGNCTLIHSENE